jgi:ABC-2 type transport system permease protein
MFWPLRLLLAKARPFDGGTIAKIAISAIIFALFLAGDFLLFLRLFGAVADVEKATPFFALGILKNLLSMVFLVAVVILFSSAMTAAIGAFFTDLDLDVYHAAPRSKISLVVSRWAKTLAESATLVYIFLIPLLVAFAWRYHTPPGFYPIALASLALLLSLPVTLGALVIVVLVRFFPVRRVNQIVATIAILVLTLAVIAFRMSRPERFFAPITTDDVAKVLSTIELPSMDLYPGTSLATYMVTGAFPWRIAIMAFALLALFVAVAPRLYFTAFVRARETMAPTALGAARITRLADRLLRPFEASTRAMIGKEVRLLTRDVAQWSQLFLMAALLFIYLYNIRMLPLAGDARATIVAYANLGMAGFVVAAICLRFAYPSISSEGKSFWMLQTAPISYRRLLVVKVLVYTAPLTALALLLTVFADVLLKANGVVWSFTLLGASLMAVTLVSLGVSLGALAPNFKAENPLQVGLSLGGFGYMGLSLTYVGGMMLLMARPVMQYVMWRGLGVEPESRLAFLIPVVTGVTVSLALTVSPLLIAEKRLVRLSESR